MGLNQPIGKRYPKKTTINLAMKESHKREYGKVIAAAALLTVLIGAFTKFGVIDRLLAASKAEYASATVKTQLMSVQTSNDDYDEILEKYEDYNLKRSIVSGKTDPLDILGLVEQELLSKSMVESFSSSDGVITVKIAGITLNEISAIFKSLTDNPLVAHVQVYTASTDEQAEDALTTATMTISLAVEAGTEIETGAKESTAKEAASGAAESTKAAVTGAAGTAEGGSGS